MHTSLIVCQLSLSSQPSPRKFAYPLGAPLPLALALLTVALPLAKPTPLPLTPRDLNIGAFLFSKRLALKISAHG